MLHFHTQDIQALEKLPLLLLSRGGWWLSCVPWCRPSGAYSHCLAPYLLLKWSFSKCEGGSESELMNKYGGSMASPITGRPVRRMTKGRATEVNFSIPSVRRLSWHGPGGH